MTGGFLSPYAGEQTVDLGGDYWVRVKKFLSVAESESAESAYYMSVRQVAGPNGRPTAAIDPVPRLFEQVLASIVEWNLTDKGGQLLPFDHDPDLERSSGRPSPRRRSLQLLPQVAFDKLSAVVGGHNNNDPENDARFRGGSEGVSGVGEDVASDDRQMDPGAAVVVDDGPPVGSDADPGSPGAGGGGVPGVDADVGGGSGETTPEEADGQTATPVEEVSV